MSPSEKVPLYSLADLNSTSDEAIPNYLNSLKFKQSHFTTDVPLALGYLCFAITGACYWWDRKWGFVDTKTYTMIAVGLFFVLNTAATCWTAFRARGVAYEGTSPSGEFISVRSSTTKNIPIYNLTVTVTAKSSKKDVYKISKPFTSWFDQTGQFVALPFQEMLANSVPLIGKCDPKRVTVSQELLDASPEVLDAILAANSPAAVATSTAAEPVSKGKGGKRRKA